MEFKRSHMCGELREENIGDEVVLMGWVAKKRNLGSLVFIDLRDKTGITQIVTREDDNENYKIAKDVAGEYVLEVKGEVRERESKNPEIPTGNIEIIASKINILDKAKTPPIYIKEDDDVSENLKLKYRYLDMRKQSVQKNLKLRSDIVRCMREYMYDNGFTEVETPFLTKPTPEGARDYLVPSRVNQGKFYALPQSPQLMKQLLMIGSLDRYFQIVKCFRDEDLRANRQPEFTQLDLELSFADQDDVIKVNEGLLKTLFDNFTDYDLKLPIQRMDYSEAMNSYGSDKPDLRYGYKINDISEIFKDCDFKVFTDNIKEGHSVRAINFKGQAGNYSRKQLDKLTDFVKDYGLKGLSFIKFNSKDDINSSIKKFLTDEIVKNLIEKLDISDNDLILIGADKNKTVLEGLGALRRKVAKDQNLYEKEYAFCWVVNFPMFEYSEEEDRYVSQHHPFTMPNEEDIDLLLTEPEKVRTQAYDIVINGDEMGGGSVRINNQELQEKVFKALKLSDDDIEQKFGFFIEALQYGTPPHAGLAYGLDRLVMLFAKTENIKDIIAFPKTQSATCPLTQAPSIVDEKSLNELSIEVKE
ncbi:aspartate--tRNA ligase [Anaerococcus sp. HMSC068A02]|uniref:Aspartate--tRNA ligase n=2 Tax=Anaerococcus vaginalis TaxID=33037 RepID=C7HTZ4_9FIRM|nr:MULTISPECIES: aspartate--tRNA ligase [Anaerococcus]EEU12774.1 aspartate--tRNA ligase [Anaerococcus vaginalis ATCC 51170]OFL14844.1 aspartate--tRNA ligase [Anaerococcus sp. HMSC068A02]QQB61120.1 aspartate--tRNA ligase [Anaerococcus vaginalis]